MKDLGRRARLSGWAGPKAAQAQSPSSPSAISALIFSMTAASNSGMTLIDAVNTYKKAVGNVPELIAIYYTSRMLKHLESLHQDGQVLVSCPIEVYSRCFYQTLSN